MKNCCFLQSCNAPALMRSGLLGLLLFIPQLLSCKEGSADSGRIFSERFEQGAKRSYAPAALKLSSGTWQLSGALIGRSEKDEKLGAAALRLAAGGSATMLFDIGTTGGTLSFLHGLFGTDRASSISCWYSTDNGRSWTQAGSTAWARSSPARVAFAVPPLERVRFSIRNAGPGRVNVDELVIGGRSRPAQALPGSSGRARIAVPVSTIGRDDNMALGNPSRAGSSDRNNYLLVHPQYSLSYNNRKGIANWVSWHLSNDWRGSAPRCNCFESDIALPKGFFGARHADYTGSGFDRGHFCPSEDRTATGHDNAVTFLTVNIAPQAPMLNAQPWRRLEEYARYLAESGYELYVIAGQYGQGGTGSKGYATGIAGGRIQVPARFWKILLILPQGDKDLQRISTTTRVIAVDMPNQQSVKGQSWEHFRTTVRDIELATGYRFFDRLPQNIAAALKARIDEN